MRIGFFFWPFAPEPTGRLARAGEELGFDLVGVADTPTNAMDPWVALTLAATATSRVRLATCVTNLVSRRPAVTAAAAASADLVAGGRTLLGVGAGHSGVLNVGAAPSSAADLAEGVAFLRRLLAGERATYRGATAHLPWVRRPVPVYAAASGPRALAASAAVADGLFVNYGLGKAEVAAVERLVDGAAAGRGGSRPDVWYVACLDCTPRRQTALDALGNILGFVAAYILGPDPAGRGVPGELVPAVQELRRRYTTRQGEMDAALVRRLGLFDYLRARLAVAGTPEDCAEHVRAAVAAGARQLMLTVSLAADSLAAVELFGREVLRDLR